MKITVDPEIQGMIDQWEPDTEYPLSVIATTDAKGNVTFSMGQTQDEGTSETPPPPPVKGPKGRMPKPVQDYMAQM